MFFDVVVERLGDDGEIFRFGDRVQARCVEALREELCLAHFVVDQTPHVYTPREIGVFGGVAGIVREISNASL